MIAQAVRRMIRRTDEAETGGAWAPFYSAIQQWTSRSGATINQQTALTLSAVWRAVDLIGDDVGMLPLFVYERLEGAGKRPARTDPLYRLLHDRPNPRTSPFAFKKLMMSWALLWGSGRAEIQRGADGRPAALWPIHPSRCKTSQKSGRIIHEVANDDGTAVPIRDEDILHLYKFSVDGLSGMSVIGKARESLGIAVKAEDYAGNFFRNNATPSAVLEHPGTLKEEAISRMRAAWHKAYGGENVQGVMVLEEGLSFKPMSMPHRDAQFLETREFQVIEVARWFGVAPHKLMDLSRATFSNIEHQSMEHDRECIMPWAVAFEQECNLKLVEGEGRFCEFLIDALLRADARTRADVLAIQRRMGIVSADEWRAKDNENPLPDGMGEVYLVPRELTTIEGLLAEAAAGGRAGSRGREAAETLAGKVELLTEWLADTLTRCLKAHANRLRRIEHKRLTDEARAGELRAADADHRDRIVESLADWWKTAAAVRPMSARRFSQVLDEFVAAGESADCGAFAERMMQT